MDGRRGLPAGRGGGGAGRAALLRLLMSLWLWGKKLIDRLRKKKGILRKQIYTVGASVSVFPPSFVQISVSVDDYIYI
jgi:hypothetical protein